MNLKHRSTPYVLSVLGVLCEEVDDNFPGLVALITRNNAGPTWCVIADFDRAGLQTVASLSVTEELP